MGERKQTEADEVKEDEGNKEEKNGKSDSDDNSK